VLSHIVKHILTSGNSYWLYLLPVDRTLACHCQHSDRDGDMVLDL